MRCILKRHRFSTWPGFLKAYLQVVASGCEFIENVTVNVATTVAFSDFAKGTGTGSNRTRPYVEDYI